MKRAMPWSDDEDDSSSVKSSASDTDTEDNEGSTKNKTKSSAISSQSSKKKTSGGESVKRKGRAMDFEALSRHGYKGGLSVLSVPPPKEPVDQNWSWSTGKESRPTNETEETYEERQKTRAAILEGEQLANARTQKEKNLSFSQKEKRKRDLGQASRGKNYVEEEKRLLRDSGVYSGFDF
ncbi:hypothetical protein RJ639_010141 [Escallonia herrerae]|uniref:Uncharacterized protein n=1 Tax=Escallonia herrerae TaxID=1293975 RepID=A0AA88VRM4_9ASTE|nr:hypothetical protein RJ639_010141 [Escallonia herrerae]